MTRCCEKAVLCNRSLIVVVVVDTAAAAADCCDMFAIFGLAVLTCSHLMFLPLAKARRFVEKLVFRSFQSSNVRSKC